MTAVIQVAFGGIVTGSIYGLLALGIVLVYRTTGVLNFAYGALSAIGASFMFELMTALRWGFWPALAAALIFAPLFGALLERICARPVLDAPIFTKAIATLALALVLETVAEQVWPALTITQRFATPFDGHSFRLGGVYISAIDVVILLVTGGVMLTLTRFLNATRLGIAMRATADSLSAARIVGVPVGLIFLTVWALSALVGTLAAVLFAGRQGLINIQFMDPLLIFAFISAVLGGLESLPGALLGGVAVGLADNLLAYLLAGHYLGPLNVSDAGIRAALIFGGFVVVLLARPQGLLGRARLRRV